MTGVASSARGARTNDLVSQRAFASGRSHSIFPKSLAIYLQRIIVSYCSRMDMRAAAGGVVYGADENDQWQHDRNESGVRGRT